MIFVIPLCFIIGYCIGLSILARKTKQGPPYTSQVDAAYETANRFATE